MMEGFAGQLTAEVDAAAARFLSLDERAVRSKSRPDRWSIQEIVGHLVDSAVNNQHRFVRAQEADPLLFPAYEQDHWVRAQAYNDTPWPELVELWRLLNRHLAHVVSQIPAEKLAVECRIGPLPPVTLGFLIEDYLVHLRHHLDQIEERRPAER